MKSKTPLFETPPVEGELWYDAQFEMDVDPVHSPGQKRWCYFSGVPTFKSQRLAVNWVNRLKKMSGAWPLPNIRIIHHFEPHALNAWVGHPVPKECIPTP